MGKDYWYPVTHVYVEVQQDYGIARTCTTDAGSVMYLLIFLLNLMGGRSFRFAGSPLNNFIPWYIK